MTSAEEWLSDIWRYTDSCTLATLQTERWEEGQHYRLHFCYMHKKNNEIPNFMLQKSVLYTVIIHHKISSEWNVKQNYMKEITSVHEANARK
jgi:hypothetical protein